MWSGDSSLSFTKEIVMKKELKDRLMMEGRPTKEGVPEAKNAQIRSS